MSLRESHGQSVGHPAQSMDSGEDSGECFLFAAGRGAVLGFSFPGRPVARSGARRPGWRDRTGACRTGHRPGHLDATTDPTSGGGGELIVHTHTIIVLITALLGW
jgi:hypothetical protein